MQTKVPVVSASSINFPIAPFIRPTSFPTLLKLMWPAVNSRCGPTILLGNACRTGAVFAFNGDDANHNVLGSLDAHPIASGWRNREINRTGRSSVDTAP